jgi:hypothetical protein
LTDRLCIGVGPRGSFFGCFLCHDELHCKVTLKKALTLNGNLLYLLCSQQR